MCEHSSKKSAQKQDYRNILTAFAVKKYSKGKKNHSGVRVCLQVMSQENKKLYYSGLNDAKKVDQIVCVEELKLKLLAKSASCPGIITIIWGLITSDSSGDPDHEEFEENFIEYINKKQHITNSNAFAVNIESI